MINVRTIRKLKDNDGLTLKYGHIVSYKSGWQVATHGWTTTSAELASKAVRAFGGNCGIWYKNNIYYIDTCHRVNTKHEALRIGKQYNQISVYG